MTPRLVDYYSRTSLISETVYDLVLREGVASLTPVRLADELAWSLTSTRRALASGRPIPEYALDLIDRHFRFRLNKPRPDTLVGGARGPRENTPTWILALDLLLIDLPWTEDRRDDALVLSRLLHGCSDQPWATQRGRELSEYRARLAAGSMAGAHDQAADAGALAALARGVTSDVTDGVLPLAAAIPIVRDFAVRRRRDLGLPTADEAALRDSA